MIHRDYEEPTATYLETGSSPVWPPEGTHAVPRLTSDHSNSLPTHVVQRLVPQVRPLAGASELRSTWTLA